MHKINEMKWIMLHADSANCKQSLQTVQKHSSYGWKDVCKMVQISDYETKTQNVIWNSGESYIRINKLQMKRQQLIITERLRWEIVQVGVT